MPPSQLPNKLPQAQPLAPVPALDLAKPGRGLWRIAGLTYLAVLTVAFAPSLFALAIHVAESELHSYILLVPFIVAYLLYLERDRLPRASSPSIWLGVLAGAAAAVSLAIALGLVAGISPLSENDYLSLMTLSFVCFLFAGGFIFLGRKWMAAAAFPVAFLLFVIPMPDAMVDALETASKLASAEAASLFFTLSGTPFLRDRTVFQLPNITIQVAQECSGIRSSWILFITSLLASYLFLRTSWRRAAIVSFVIPLGILRNGFRILVIGLLCVHLGPDMIHSAIHRRGGPVFFALSLIPLFALLWWLRRGEGKQLLIPSATGGSRLAETPK